MKTVFASSILLSDFVRAEAGDSAAVLDSRIAALYSAAYHIMKAGNKTQFNLLTTACATYADVKACKQAMGVTTVNAGVKRMHAVYQAYGAALAQCGVPALMKGADHAQLDDAAALYATQFASVIDIALAPVAKVAKTEDEKAAAKAEKEAKVKAAQAEVDAAIEAKAQAIAGASVVTLADMVGIVANAIKQGMLDADALAVLDGALDAVAANVSFVPVAEGEALHA